MTLPPAQLAPPSPEASVSMRVVWGLLHTVEQAGVPQLKLWHAARLDPAQLESAQARLPRWLVYQLLEHAMELTGDPALGLHWADRLDTSALPPISHLISHAATLRHAFECLEEFRPLLSDHLGYELIEQGNEVTVRCLSLPSASPHAQRFVAEMIVIGLFRLVRLFNPRGRLARVSFAYAAPSYHDEYTRVFGRTASFDQSFTGIVFDSALMNAASPYKDKDLHDALRSIVERRVLDLADRTPYALRVRDFLVQQSAPQKCDMKTVASALGLSVRSLRRRLDAEAKPYDAILSEACAIVAKRLLLDRRRTVQEAAYELGFSGTTAFHRAFKRWTGMTPSSFRKQELGTRADG